MAHGITKAKTGFLSRLFKPIVEKHLDRLANKIADEIRQEIINGGHVNTGEALNSIYIEKGDRTRFIGSNSDHFYYLDKGSKATKKYIRFTPKVVDRSKRPNAPPVHSMGRKAIKGANIIEKVANRHK